VHLLESFPLWQLSLSTTATLLLATRLLLTTASTATATACSCLLLVLLAQVDRVNDSAGLEQHILACELSHTLCCVPLLAYRLPHSPLILLLACERVRHLLVERRHSTHNTQVCVSTTAKQTYILPLESSLVVLRFEY
jgi:hypothetical protein